MKWIDFVKEVEKQAKESRPEIDLKTIEIAYIDIAYTSKITIGFNQDKLVVLEDYE